MPGFEITNYTEWPITVSLEQVGPLYYDIVYPGQTFKRDTGAVWFTVKAQLSPDGKCVVHLVDAVVPIVALSLTALLAASPAGMAVYGPVALRHVAWAAIKAGAKAVIKSGAKAVAVSASGVPKPTPSDLTKIGFTVQTQESPSLRETPIFAEAFSRWNPDNVVEDMGEFAGWSGRRKYWVTGGPKVWLVEDTGQGRGLVVDTSPLQLTRSRPGPRDLERDALVITRTATSENFIYLDEWWHEIPSDVIPVVRGSKWMWTIPMTEEQIRTEIGEMKQGRPISPKIENGCYLKGSVHGYYVVYDGLLSQLPPGREYPQAIEVPDRLIECMREVPDGTLVTTLSGDIYFMARGKRRKFGTKVEFPKDVRISPTMWHMPIAQQVFVNRMFDIDAVQALNGGLKRNIQLSTEALSIIPEGPDLPVDLRNGVVVQGDGRKRYLLAGGRRAEYQGSYQPDEFFDLPDVIESVPLVTSENFAESLKTDGVIVSDAIRQKLERLGEQPIRELPQYDLTTNRYYDPALLFGPPSSPGFVGSGGNDVDPAYYTGRYERHPIENDWHIGEISLDSTGQLRWTNRAGVTWSIETPTKYEVKLALGDDNPYRDYWPKGSKPPATSLSSVPLRDCDHFQFFTGKTSYFLGFWFLGEFYTYSRKSQPEWEMLHRENLGLSFRGSTSDGEKLPYRHPVIFPSSQDPENSHRPPPWGVYSVVVLSDWWNKRPKRITVYDQGDVVLGEAWFPTRDMMCCGEKGDEECSVDRSTSQLVVPLEGIRWLDGLVVEIDEPLSGDSAMALLKGIEVRGYGMECFLSSACLRARGLPDDCEELTVLRAFRDGWVAHQPGGGDAIREYYAIAPGIVRAIDARPDAAGLYEAIYNGLVCQVVALIQEGRQPEATKSYRRFVESLKKTLGL